jgi:putative endonuclease
MFGLFQLKAMKIYQVYIQYSQNFDTYYIGQTQDVIERLERHNKGYEQSTSRYKPWKLVLTISKSSRNEALKLEKKLKNLSRSRLEQFIIKYG